MRNLEPLCSLPLLFPCPEYYCMVKEVSNSQNWQMSPSIHVSFKASFKAIMGLREHVIFFAFCCSSSIMSGGLSQLTIYCSSKWRDIPLLHNMPATQGICYCVQARLCYGLEFPLFICTHAHFLFLGPSRPLLPFCELVCNKLAILQHNRHCSWI